jgi:hypothetical protein
MDHRINISEIATSTKRMDVMCDAKPTFCFKNEHSEFD